MFFEKGLRGTIDDFDGGKYIREYISGYDKLRGRKKMTVRTPMFFMIPIVIILLCLPLACSETPPAEDNQYPK